MGLYEGSTRRGRAFTSGKSSSLSDFTLVSFRWIGQFFQLLLQLDGRRSQAPVSPIDKMDVFPVIQRRHIAGHDGRIGGVGAEAQACFFPGFAKKFTDLHHLFVRTVQDHSKDIIELSEVGVGRDCTSVVTYSGEESNKTEFEQDKGLGGFNVAREASPERFLNPGIGLQHGGVASVIHGFNFDRIGVLDTRFHDVLKPLEELPEGGLVPFGLIGQ